MDATTHATRHASSIRRGAAALLALVLAALMAACGGSGSSGFDALAAENRAIDRVVRGQGCTVENGLTICASGASESPPPASATPSPTGTPAPVPSVTGTPGAMPSTSPTAGITATRTAPQSPTPTATRAAPGPPEVDVGLSPGDIANCEAVDVSQTCVVRVSFSPVNAPVGAMYRAVSRLREPDTVWTVHPDTPLHAVVVVPPEATTVQVAVLMYYGDPGPLPEELELLADSGADVAFVAAPVAVRD